MKEHGGARAVRIRRAAGCAVAQTRSALVLGTGKRFFRDGNDKTTLELVRTETAGTGVVMLVCTPAA